MLAVVAKGPYDNYLPIVLRNNTKQALAAVHVAGTATDAAGRLLVTGRDQGIQPEVIPPGGLAIGYVFLGGTKLPASARFKLDVRSIPANRVTFQADVDVPIKTIRYVGGQVVGVGKNTTGKKVSGPISIYAACFDGANRFVVFASSYGDKDVAQPGEEVPFTVDLTVFQTQSAPVCAHLLVSARGYSF